jgi:polyisoprenoid-binding protein YceI
MHHRAINFASTAFFVTSLALARHTWILDSSRSNARLFQGAEANSELVNSGVARVTGKVKLDTNDLDASFFDLSIYPHPEDERWEHALNPEGTLPTIHVPRAKGRSMLTFKSTSILGTGNGTLEVIGNLTLARVERTVMATPTEAYAGPVCGDLVIHNEARAITFVFPSASAANLSTPLIPTMAQKREVLQIVGSARVEREEFPEKLAAIKDSNGAPCTAPPIALTRENNCQAPVSAEEDCSGTQCTPVAGNQTAIVLDLKFHHTVPEPSVRMLLESSETR